MYLLQTHIDETGCISHLDVCRPPGRLIEDGWMLEAIILRGGDPPAYRAGLNWVHTAKAGFFADDLKSSVFSFPRSNAVPPHPFSLTEKSIE